jgi:glutamate 5-kinase
MAHVRKFRDLNRIIVKIGTSVLSRPDGVLNKNYMRQVAGQVSELVKQGKTVIIVSSGAIASGVRGLDLETMPKDIPSRQAAAAVGQSILMETWRRVFRKHGIEVAQILLTYEAFSVRRTYLNLRNSMTILTKRKAVPIVNENDPISVHEIEATFGDNDKLSAMVAANTDAQLLILLTDVNGLYTRNPRHQDARLISEVTEITQAIERMGGAPGSWRTKGGMKTKIEAARIATSSNCFMVIANAQEKDVITRIVQGEEIGTLFRPVKSYSSRQRWISHSISNGRIDVDQKAGEALLRGGSLLPSGVIKVDGQFEVGSVVNIFSNGSEIAKGVVDYSSEELNKIKGKHTSQIEGILGYKSHNNVVRRENMSFTDL